MRPCLCRLREGADRALRDFPGTDISLPASHRAVRRQRAHAGTAVSPPLIETRNVECRFRVGSGLFGSGRELRAVNGISLELRRGEVLGIVGESGCGKSTL